MLIYSFRVQKQNRNPVTQIFEDTDLLGTVYLR